MYPRTDTSKTHRSESRVRRPTQKTVIKANISAQAPETKEVQLTTLQTKPKKAQPEDIKHVESKRQMMSRDTSFSLNIAGSNFKNTSKPAQKRTQSKPSKKSARYTTNTRRSTQSSVRKSANIDGSDTKSSKTSVRDTYGLSTIREVKLRDTKLEQLQIEQKKIHLSKGIKSKEKVTQSVTQKKSPDKKEVLITKTPLKQDRLIKEIELYEDPCEEMEVDVEESNFKLVKINLKRCMYKVVEDVALSLAMEPSRDDEDHSWDVYWSDYSITTVKSKSMTLRQRINHFPGMANLESKAFLAYHLNRMKLEFPLDYNFFPGSWSLPYQNQECMTYVENHPQEVFILKPSRGAEGKGIKVFSKVEDIKANTAEAVCQMYLSKLLLLDNYKFDLRVYVLITCIDPLQIFVYNNGLVRLATHPYAAPKASNMNNQFMHLTNYSINKSSSNYDPSEEGSKRDFTAFNRWMLAKVLNSEKLWKDIDDVIIKTFIAIHPILKDKYVELFPIHYKHNVSACFELLGFDIIIDRAMKPFLLEVNRSPSFNIMGEVDERVKQNLIEDTFRLLNLQSAFPSRDQLNPIGNYRQIYPTARSYEYSTFVHFISTVPATNEDKKRKKQMS